MICPYTKNELHLILKSNLLNEIPYVSHGFFTREGGVSKGVYSSLNCGLGSEDIRDYVLQNRAYVAGMLGFSASNLVANAQIHSTKVVNVVETWAPENAPQADGLVTNVPNILLCAAGADCGVVHMADKTQEIIGTCHAGWRGAVSGILENTITAMERLGAHKENICACLGPTISQSVYEVGEEVYEQALTQTPWATNCFIRNTENKKKFLFNLPFYIESRLSLAKISKFENLNLCTYSNPQHFYSFRRATHLNQKDYGRHFHGIGILRKGFQDI